MKKIIATKHLKERSLERLAPKGALGKALYDPVAVMKILRSVGEDHYEFLTKGKKLAAVFNKINDRDRPVAIFEGDDTTVYIKTVYTECKDPYEITRQSTHTDLVCRIGKDLIY